METWRFCFIGLALVGAAGVEKVLAECVVIPQSLSQRLTSRQLVFVGEVLTVDTVILDPKPFVYRVRFRVQEVFKGTSVGERAFDFGNSPDDFSFKSGQRVIVYANRDDRGWASTACSATRAAVPDDPEVVELRRLSRSK